MKVFRRHLNEKGSLYPEMLLSFFVWLIIIMIIIPSFLYLSLKRKEIEVEYAAQSVLNDHVIKLIMEEDSTFKGDINEDFFIQTERMENSTKICIRYLFPKDIEKELCRFIPN